MENNLPYLHGFSQEEQDRLRRQARFAEHTIFRNVNFSGCKQVLEVGCGVGAQTEILLRRYPEAFVTGIELNQKQLSSATQSLKNFPEFEKRYALKQMDATDMEFKRDEFDGAYLCWVLEHIPSPQRVFSELKRVLKDGSKIFITEVLNTSLLIDPYSPNVWKFWMAFNDFQYDHGGDPFVGAKLGNLLLSGGFNNIKVETITWHLDNRNPKLREDYLDYWSELLLSATDQLIESEYITKDVAEKAKEELRKVKKDPNAVIYDAFIQASARA